MRRHLFVRKKQLSYLKEKDKIKLEVALVGEIKYVAPPTELNGIESALTSELVKKA